MDADLLRIGRSWLLCALLFTVGVSACGVAEVTVGPTAAPEAATAAALATENALLRTQVAMLATPATAPTSSLSPLATVLPGTATAFAPTATATVGPTQPHTPAPTAMPVITPIVCEDVPIRGFGNVWAQHVEVRQGLGCPSWYYYCYQGSCSGEQPMVSAVQRFEHGTMIWVDRPTWEGTRWVYVLFEEGDYQRFKDTFQDGDPESDPSIIPPQGFYQPIRGFGKVWREGTGAQVRERLGWAVEPEQGGDGAWQDFQRGSMYWIGPVDRIYVIYAYDVNYNQVHSYEEFADTF